MSFEDTRSRVLKMIQERHPGWHPIVALADVAVNEDNPLDLRVSCMKTITPYCEAQLKSIEVNANVKQDFGILRVVMSDEDDEDPQVEDDDEDRATTAAVLGASTLIAAATSSGLTLEEMED